MNKIEAQKQISETETLISGLKKLHKHLFEKGYLTYGLCKELTNMDDMSIEEFGSVLRAIDEDLEKTGLPFLFNPGDYDVRNEWLEKKIKTALENLFYLKYEFEKDFIKNLNEDYEKNKEHYIKFINEG